MRYYDDMDSKSGFNDGASVPPDADECREVYVEVINALAAKHKSGLRVVAFDRPGLHNHCLILRVLLRDFESLPEDAASLQKTLCYLANVEPELDEGLSDALDEAETWDLDSLVEVKTVVNRPRLQKILHRITGSVPAPATEPLKSFILTGDVTRAAKVRAKGTSNAEAILAAESGNFEVVEEFKGWEEFRLDAEDPDHVEVEEES